MAESISSERLMIFKLVSALSNLRAPSVVTTFLAPASNCTVLQTINVKTGKKADIPL